MSYSVLERPILLQNVKKGEKMLKNGWKIVAKCWKNVEKMLKKV